MSTERKHHYVPRFYLAGFTATDHGGRLLVHDGKTGKQWTSRVEDIACQRDFYKMESSEPGFDPLTVEKSLGEIESLAAPGIQHIVEHGSLPMGEHYDAIMVFLGCLALRVPRFRELVRESELKLYGMMLRMYAADDERWAGLMKSIEAEGGAAELAAQKLLREQIRDGRLRMTLTQSAAVATMFGKHLTAIVELLGRRRWSVLTAPSDGPHFITSDNPLTLHWTSASDMGGYSPGFGVAGTTVLFPVSRERIIVGTFEGGLPQATITSTLAALANRMTAAHAHQYCYAGSVSDLPERSGSPIQHKRPLRKRRGRKA